MNVFSYPVRWKLYVDKFPGKLLLTNKIPVAGSDMLFKTLEKYLEFQSKWDDCINEIHEEETKNILQELENKEK